ncbi:MAG: site-specific DNA-methyltransferase [Finegoldia magna]|uniref:site-specific DNA-methyltransferase n=1 Tax=Finegoldia magna TaxID=1260 RepID=UPI00290E9D38|nr:site-specific DNA-methyltransferase [Finegoldia magna]MDU7479210.1 site-specific DNA-methyltransferase [Finegoldia magna]
MDKMDMQTPNMADEKLKKLIEIFPNIVTETIDEDGNVVRAIDKDILEQEISSKVVEGREERYQFTWPDKKKSILAANAPISKTLRPCRDESKNFDTTENLYIEGDNLEVLKLLQETYLGQIKMIYIDPPYNTGNDFVYNDDFKQTTDEYLEDSGQFDEEGNRLDKNLESNGRFHTDWLNMIYPRLKLARNLLNDDGVIFISIDDNEQANLKKVCDEVFGEKNFICNFKWNRTSTPPSLSKKVRLKYEYILCYEKRRNNIEYNGGVSEGGDMPLLNEGNSIRKLIFPKNNVYFGFDGSYEAGNYHKVRLISDIRINNGISDKDVIIEGQFKWTQEKLNEELQNGTKVFIKSIKFAPRYLRNKIKNKKPSDIISKQECNVGTNEDAAKGIISLFNKNIMDYPKPDSLINYFIPFAEINKESIILDFFSGSATTAEAVMQLNAEDGGNRKFIMVQLPEQTDEKSEAYKAGYKNICEIGKERIRRAGEKILEENKDKENIDKLDVGFRVLKTDSSNMKDVYYTPENTEQSFLDSLEDNIKEDRTQEDLLFQVMLDLGVPLSSTIEVEQIEDAKVFKVEDRFLVACFDGSISDEVVKQIADMKPFYAVFRDMSMKNDSVAVNFEQIFESISPETIRKVL